MYIGQHSPCDIHAAYDGQVEFYIGSSSTKWPSCILISCMAWYKVMKTVRIMVFRHFPAKYTVQSALELSWQVSNCFNTCSSHSRLEGYFLPVDTTELYCEHTKVCVFTAEMAKQPSNLAAHTCSLVSECQLNIISHYNFAQSKEEQGKHSQITVFTYCKIPKISPKADIIQRPYSRGIFLEGVIFGGAYLSRSTGLALKLKVNLQFLLCNATFQVQASGEAYIWRDDLTEGFSHYRFGGLIHGGANFRNFTVHQFNI